MEQKAVKMKNHKPATNLLRTSKQVRQVVKKNLVDNDQVKRADMVETPAWKNPGMVDDQEKAGNVVKKVTMLSPAMSAVEEKVPDLFALLVNPVVKAKSVVLKKATNVVRKVEKR